MRFETGEGEGAFAAVRNLTAAPGQVALTAPLAEALAPWRETAQIMTALLAATGLILGGSLGFYRLDATRSRARVAREAVKRAHSNSRSIGDAAAFGTGISTAAGRPGRDRCSTCSVWSSARALRSPEMKSWSIPDDKPRAVSRGGARRRRRVDRSRIPHARARRALGLAAQAREIVDDEEIGRHRLVGIALDVTDAKREAEVSATADQRLREAIEAISEAFVLWDSCNRLVLCNSKYQRLHDLPAEADRRGAPMPIWPRSRRRRSSPARLW